MRKPVRVLLVGGDGIGALDFERLLRQLGRTGATAGDGGSNAPPALPCDGDAADGTVRGTEDELARARDFICRQHGVGEPWFCYVNLRRAPGLPAGRRSTTPAERARNGRLRSSRTATKPERSR